MLNLWLLVIVIGLGLMVLVWAGSIFIQGYIYTEASRQLHWQAPAAGAVMALFYGIWCFIVAKSPDTSTNNIPYDAFHRFSPNVYMSRDPVKELWAVKKNDQKVRYKLFKSPGVTTTYSYKDTTLAEHNWTSSGLKAIELEHGGQKYRFEEQAVARGAYAEYRTDDGWTMTVTESGPNGTPKRFRASLFLANCFLNGMHLILWFLVLWLLTRFQWPHALGIGFLLWLLFTLVLLPMILDFAAGIAQTRPVQTAEIQIPSAHGECGLL